MRARFGYLSFVPLAVALGVSCVGTADDEGTTDTSDLTGTTSVERGIQFQAWVYVPVDSSDDAIKIAIARQVKTAIGALRSPKVALNDRASQANLEASKWVRETLQVFDAKSPKQPVGSVLRVRYAYDDRAVVTQSLSAKSSVDLTMLPRGALVRRRARLQRPLALRPRPARADALQREELQ